MVPGAHHRIRVHLHAAHLHAHGLGLDNKAHPGDPKMTDSSIFQFVRFAVALAVLSLSACFDHPPVIEDAEGSTGSTSAAGTRSTDHDAGSGESTSHGESAGTGPSTTGSTGGSGSDTGSMCTNGIVEPGEECDDGNQVETDGCTNTCRHPICGDGIVHVGSEQCDDGNKVETDDCLTSCIPATCGDGFLHEGVEVCDDGNTEPGDTCLSNCQLAVCQSIVDAVEDPICQECAGNDALPNDQQCCIEAASCNQDCQCVYTCLYVGASPCSLLCPEADLLEETLAMELFTCIHQGPCSAQCPTS